MSHKVLVIVPTYNEAENIEKLILAVLGQAYRLPGSQLGILIVDDRSPDGTADIVTSLQESHRNIFLTLGKKAGLGRAYIRGFKHAQRTLKPDTIIMMDADFSHDPAAIPQLIAELENGADYVIGSRYVIGGSIPGSWPILRILNSRVANGLANFMLNPKPAILDTTGGFKAIRATSLREIDLDSISVSGYAFQVSLLHAFMQNGSVIREVPIIFTDREFGESKMRLRDILEFIHSVSRLNHDSTLHVAVRYAMVGASGTIVNLGVLAFLTKIAGVQPLIGVIFGIEISIITNFFLNNSFTFKPVFAADTMAMSSILKPKTSLLVRFAKYQVGALITAAISYGLFWSFYRYAHIDYLLADLFSIAIAMVFSFMFNSKLVWGRANA